MTQRRIAILGAGGWGTALAICWANKGHEVTLWGHNHARVRRLVADRVNADYLPDTALPESISITSELQDCAAADIVAFVTPSTALRDVAEQLRGAIPQSDAALLTCTKGIEHGSGRRMSEVLGEVFPGRRIAALSGPNLAIEVARGLPTATVLGCGEHDCAEELQRALGTERFRIYTTDETVGVELGGALKNVFAIGAGISDGLGFGDNSKAALVTRSLSELVRIGTALGGNARTFYGLSGAGDLIATAFSKHSRNRRVGEQLGRGMSLGEITADMRTVAEGVPTAESAFDCARKVGVDTPIIDVVHAIIHRGMKPLEGLRELLQRDLKSERS